MRKVKKFSRVVARKEIGRAHCCDKANVERGPWSIEEDSKLKEYIEKYGTEENWIALPQKAGLKRCRKSCRLEWLNQFLALQCHGQAFWLESCVRELESDEAFESCSLAIDNNNNLPIPIN